MKKYYLFLLISFLFIGCTNDISNIEKLDISSVNNEFNATNVFNKAKSLILNDKKNGDFSYYFSLNWGKTNNKIKTKLEISTFNRKLEEYIKEKNIQCSLENYLYKELKKMDKKYDC